MDKAASTEVELCEGMFLQCPTSKMHFIALKTTIKYTKWRLLPPCCPLLAMTGWMRRRHRCRDAERRPGRQKHEAAIALILSKHVTVNKCRKIRSPVLTGIRLLYLVLVVMLTALLLRFHRSDGSQKAAPCLASKHRTDSGRAGLHWQRNAPPPPHSQSHCRVSYKRDLHDVSRRSGSKPAPLTPVTVYNKSEIDFIF